MKKISKILLYCTKAKPYLVRKIYLNLNTTTMVM